MIICKPVRKVLEGAAGSKSVSHQTLRVLGIVVMAIMLSVSAVGPAAAKGGDSDNDGLANGAEKKYGTERKNPDTDGDGLQDGYEVFTSFSDPTLYDSDADGLSDGSEVNIGTLLDNPDTDDDGLEDGVEFWQYGTSPVHYDTDLDSLSDYAEIFATETDPRNWDTDGDGVGDGEDRAPLSRWVS